MNNDRQKLLDLLADLSAVAPDLRLGQMLVALSLRVRGAHPENIYDVEDSELLVAASQMIEMYRTRDLQVA